MATNIFSNNWEALEWSEWISLDTPHKIFKQITTEPGVYRVRAIGLDVLIYIGQTGRNLRERLNDLRRNIYGSIMPYNDPHTASPNLWAWYQEEKYNYECSVAIVNLSKPNRQALEDMMLWKNRIDTGKSTLCNYGRFHPRYIKSKDRKSRFRGYKLPPNEQNPSGGISTVALYSHGMPIDLDWMGLSWSPFIRLDENAFKQISRTKGLYRLISSDKNRILYIGETKNLRNRCRSHQNFDWNDQSVGVSYVSFGEEILEYQLRELEVDLIGCYFFTCGEAPLFQYGG